MKIKKFNEYEELNENIALEVLSTIGILFNFLKIYASFKITEKGSIDYTLMNELKEIIGREIKIIRVEGKKKKNPAFASSNTIFYDKGLVKYLTHRELLSIVLHESSHVTSKDVVKQTILKMFKFIPIILLDSWLLYILSPIVTGIVYISPYKRLCEYTADSIAKKYGYGEDLSSALIKINHYYGMESKDLGLITNKLYKALEKLVNLLKSHPSLSNRIKKLYDKENPQEFISKIKAEIIEKEKVDLLSEVDKIKHKINVTIKDNQNTEIKQIFSPEQHIKYQELLNKHKKKEMDIE